MRQPADCPDAAQALAQCERLTELAARQSANLAEARRGLREAAGLATPEPSSLALATAVAVQIPPECDVVTFYAYVEQGKYARALAATDSAFALCRASG